MADGRLSLRMFVNFGENLCERDVLALGEDGYFGQCAHFGVACGIHAFAVRQRLDDDAARRLCDVFVQTGLAGNGQNLFQFHNFFCSMICLSLVLHCPFGPCGVNPLRLVPFENAVSDGIYAVLLGFGYGRKAVLVGHDDQPIYRTAGFLCRDDCFVKDRVGSRLEIVGIGRFLLRVLYSVLIGPFDVDFT